MPRKYVFIPFSREDECKEYSESERDWVPVSAENWVTQKAGEWRTVKDRGVKHAGLNQPLRTVGNGNTLYIQAEGFSNNLTAIGGPGGAPCMDAEGLLDVLKEAGLRPLQGLKIKIWACFSGLFFAKAFYEVATTYFGAGLIVDGYNGETRLDGRKKVLKFGLIRRDRFSGTKNVVRNIDPAEYIAQENRVRYGPSRGTATAGVGPIRHRRGRRSSE